MTETVLDYPAPQAVNISHLTRNQVETPLTAAEKQPTTSPAVDATTSPQDSHPNTSPDTTQEDGRRPTDHDNTNDLVESPPEPSSDAPTSKTDDPEKSKDKEFFIDTIV